MKIRVWYVVALWTYDNEYHKIYTYKDFYEYEKGPMSFNDAYDWMIENQVFDDTHGKKYDMIFDYIELIPSRY